MNEIKVRYHANIPELTKISVGDWIDLYCAKDIFIKHHDFQMIPLGISMQLPPGYEAHIVPRSSTFSKYGIIMVNSMGIIDSTYCGDNDIWKFPAYCLEWRGIDESGRKGSFIKRGDRICQFRIMQNQPDITFERVNHLGGPNRGGFGSTGR